MKCHYTTDKKAGKVLIPGCMSVAVHNDIDKCCCPTHPKSFKQFEKGEFNKILTKQSKMIAELENEIIRLNKGR